MKNTCLIVLVLIIPMMSFAQISTTKVAKEVEVVEEYDSTKNFLGIDYLKYKGQELYLIPKSIKTRNEGYSGFFNTPDENYMSSLKKMVFHLDKKTFSSKYSDLQAQFFYVEDIIDKNNGVYCYLQLRMKSTNEIVYYKYFMEEKYSNIFPFLVTGYYEKQKDIYVGRNILVKATSKFSAINTVNGKKLNGIEYKCIDLTLDENDYNLVLLLKDKNGIKATYLFQAVNNNPQIIFTDKEVHLYKKMFGGLIWDKIINGKIDLGFTEEMVRLSWGNPDEINRASYGDQWVYGNQYLYFENGKLTSFN